jgi:predicted Zn-dependent protease
MGLYPDSSLQRYMQQFGERLAATTVKPDLPWTFRVLDDHVVNAFALPGGFNYVTRGILAHMNSEAQLAAVVGHEIGHVTARHSAAQMSRAQLAQVGLVAGVILAPQLADFAGAASAGMGLLFLKFGRDDERQSDDLGLQYMVAAGFDPRPAPDVFRMLERVSAAQGGGSTPEWLSTHPNPANRAERLEQAIAELNLSYSGRVVGRAEYLARLDNMVYGPNPREGFFRDNVFLHPELAFQFTFPSGWRTINQRQAVVGVNSDQTAIIQVQLAEGGSASAAAGAFFGQEGITGRPSGSRINGHTAAGGEFTAATEQGQLAGAVNFVEYNGNVYQLLGYATAQGWSSSSGTVRSSLGSFDRLTDRSALDAQPQRLDIVTVDRAMSLSEFNQRYPSAVSLDEVALLNQVDPGSRIAAGTAVKRVVQ